MKKLNAITLAGFALCGFLLGMKALGLAEAGITLLEDLAFPLGQRRVLYWSRCMVRSVHRRVHHAQFSRLLAVQHGLNALN